MQNIKNSKNYFFLFGAIIFIMDVLLVSTRKDFNSDYIMWLLISAAFIYLSRSNFLKEFFRKKLESKMTDFIFQDFTLKFLTLFSAKIVLDILARLFQDYIFYVSILEIFLMIAMAYLMGKFAFEYGQKKIYWIFGLFGFVWIATIGIFLGYLSVLELKTEKDDDRI